MLKKAFFTNSSGILCSRIFGFLRDIFTAQVLGAGVFSDIFFAAFKFPNLFRRIFGEGAFVQSFLPSLIASKRKGVFIVTTFLIFVCVILILSLFVWWFSGFFTKILAYGFDEHKLELTRPIVVINFWYLELVFIATFFSSLLQYKNVFWVSAYNTTLLNIFMILSLFLAKDKEGMQIVYFLSYGVLCGGVAQIIMHFYPLYQKRFFKLFIIGFIDLYTLLKNQAKASTRTAYQKSVKGFFRQFFPALFGSSTAQIAAFLDTILASFLASGSISYLYYANRIFQLPLAIFAIAISTALFPTIARAIANQEEKKAHVLLRKSFWILCILLCVCVCGGILLKNEIIFLLFERGAFHRLDTLNTADVFAIYMVGLVPYGLAKLFSLWLYAHKRQGYAAIISAISLLVGFVSSFILMQKYGVYGLACGSSIAGFILFILTMKFFGWKNFYGIFEKKFCLLLVGALLLETGIILALKSLWHIV